MIPTQTLGRVLRAQERRVSEKNSKVEATGELTELIGAIALGVKMISQLVATAGFKGLYGYTGNTNSMGDKTNLLDQECDQILVDILGTSGHFGLLVSEEHESVISTETATAQAKYVVAFDPLDGSSNVGSNIPVGTIFSIFRRKDMKSAPSAKDFMQSGRELVAAGYSIYGAMTSFIYSCGDGVHGFTLDPGIGEFVMTDEKLRIPERGSTYSTNEGNFASWDAGTKRYIESLKTKNAELQTPYSARYVGSLVADFDRNMRKGGIFLYPSTASHARGRLRLLYEVMPLSFIIDQAGGRATDGVRDILDIVPTDIHERSPFIVGSRHDVEMYLKALS